MANRLVMGAVDGSYKLKVSKPGYDVMTALTNEQLAFSTDWDDAGKVLMTGSATLNGSGILQMTVPFFTERLNVMAMVKIGSVYWPMSTFGSNINQNASIGLRPDISTVAFFGGTGSGGCVFYYAIMENQFDN
ncbi:hypothetical protein [Mesorhizobium sp. M7A.F.Ca.MR.362.00.0.0]|uniref:hypothetical protein n=1 Tax=Mesorhizobium sp. M7A.F.Ca.MR.362.00.0.0 TaxID=2496779 RepID=UPI000FD33044|nr:hypothetical protein [Mesorhizobium sp. M7A.F.Ca.MR.362.00.0.0]RUU75714.1 hypothetical protein EOC06_29545 [Mesorhizobium sp. M7A.F.Ca.MR.362.00.0.0]RWN95459.1 MAG: hypothetical protein EOS05_11740 [Mesorhizobium sp.]